LVRVNPAICFAFIKSLSTDLRHAAFAKREAFFVPGIRTSSTNRKI
jgi:hypothetical protein